MWQMTGEDVSTIEQQFLLEQDMKNVDLKYFKELLHKVPANVQELDGHIAPLLDRPFNELDPVECAIMRLGVYELQHRLDIPYRVVINEAVELTKIFGAEEGHKYVNSILDRVAKKLRAIEVAARRSTPNR